MHDLVALSEHCQRKTILVSDVSIHFAIQAQNTQLISIGHLGVEKVGSTHLWIRSAYLEPKEEESTR